MNSFKLILSLASLVVASSATAQTARPPQYIMMSFDGSYGNAMWAETREFGLKSNAKFTHFVSGVDFLIGSSSGPIPGETKRIYTPPKATGLCSTKNPSCTSDVGFGGTAAMLKERILQVTKSLLAGMEIAGHGNSHFNGTTWNEKEWTHEFNWFHKIFAQTFSINKIPEGGNLPFEQDWKYSVLDQLQGFRAPYLGVGEGLWQSMAKSDWYIDNDASSIKYKYDASQVSDQLSKWPVRSKYGLWQFPLVQLPVPGRTRKIISMDYNFYVSQSNGVLDPVNAPLYEEQMYQAYANWFLRNYHGNRAPINIGHHFSTWNNGAYWKALQRFSRTVCSMPEVKCVTYNEMVDALENQRLETQIANFNANQFDQSNRPQVTIPMKTLVSSSLDQSVVKGAVVNGRFASNAKNQFQWSLNGQDLNGTIDLANIAKAGHTNIDVSIRGSKDKASLYIDWNPATDTVKLRKLENDTNSTCPPEAHGEEGSTGLKGVSI